MHQQLLGLVTVPTQTSVSTSWCVTAVRPRRTSTCRRYKVGTGGNWKAFGFWLLMKGGESFTVFSRRGGVGLVVGLDDLRGLFQT